MNYCLHGTEEKRGKNVKEIEFLKKSNDEKGHVFELLFSDELYNFLFGEVKRGVFLGINRSTFCFEE